MDFQNELDELKKPNFDEVLDTLQSESKENATIVSALLLRGLSDLSINNQERLIGIWNRLDSSYLQVLLQALIDAYETNYEYNYRQIGLIGLTDKSAVVRGASIDLLWEDKSVDTMKKLINLIQNDESSHVKSRAFVGLGKFILLGEYGEIPYDIAEEAQRLAYEYFMEDAKPVEIRRRALEALANSSHPQKDKLIRQAYHSDNQLLKVSAVFSMGRTCDEKWQDILLEELDSSDSEIVFEAVRACGEIQVETSVPQIRELTQSDDHEIQAMSIWALGEIGGKMALETLVEIQEMEEDDALLEIIDEALDAASFSLTGSSFNFDIDD